MKLKNQDILVKEKETVMESIRQAIDSGDKEAFKNAFTKFTELLQEATLEEAKGNIKAEDNRILAGRGVRVLTSEEKTYYEKVISAMGSPAPQQALDLIDETMPLTVIDAVLDDIKEEHPLLAEINFQNTGVLTNIIVSKLDSRFIAVWGDLCDEVVKEVSAGTELITLNQKKLSAFIPICKAMLDIGPAWIDRYVRAILSEAIANGLEKAIVDGSGVKEPIGMTRNPEGTKDPTTGYESLDVENLDEITPKTYGAIIASLAKSPNNLYRTVGTVLLVCNPYDYYSKLSPAVMFQNADGTWANRFPYPTKVVTSVHVPENKIIIGLGKRYFFGLGTSKGGKIEHSDHARFLEDERLYLTKLYGHGQPLDGKSFKVLNITNLESVPAKVEVVNIDEMPNA